MKNLTDQMKALGDLTRLRILGLLMERELCVCEILAVLQLPQSTVSRHLAILRRAGWLDDRRQGSWMYYRIAERPADHQRLMLQGLLPALSAADQGIADRLKLESFLQSPSHGPNCKAGALS
jgi:ArsR family transcriptional regulator, arsenate/arsenite/antimonite-responsive transcriptional repressor